MFETLISAVAGKLDTAKYVLYAILAGAIFYGGYVTGHNAEAAVNVAVVADLNKQIAGLTDALGKEKLVVSDTIARINVDAAKRIAAATDKVKEIDVFTRKQINQYQLDYAKQTKELEDAKLNAITNALTVPATVGNATDGLWVFVETATCATTSGQGSAGSGNNPVPSTAASPGGSGVSQCRLSGQTSVPLIKIVSEADSVALQLNLCYKASSIQPQTN